VCATSRLLGVLPVVSIAGTSDVIDGQDHLEFNDAAGICRAVQS
jgi:hypothetical protein